MFCNQATGVDVKVGMNSVNKKLLENAVAEMKLVLQKARAKLGLKDTENPDLVKLCNLFLRPAFLSRLLEDINRPFLNQPELMLTADHIDLCFRTRLVLIALLSLFTNNVFC